MISKIDNKITSIHFALSGANADSLLLTCNDAVRVISARSNWRDENLANGGEGGQFPSAPSLPPLEPTLERGTRCQNLQARFARP